MTKKMKSFEDRLEVGYGKGAAPRALVGIPASSGQLYRGSK